MKAPTHLRHSRSPWPVAIVAFFVVFITFMTGFIAWATRQNMDLVRTDYYENEIRYQQQIDALQRTAPFKSELKLQYQARSVMVQIPLQHAANAKGEIHFYRPSNAGLDRRLPLQVDATGKQVTKLEGLEAGFWKANVRWSVDGQDYCFERSFTVADAVE